MTIGDFALNYYHPIHVDVDVTLNDRIMQPSSEIVNSDHLIRSLGLFYKAKFNQAFKDEKEQQLMTL